MTRADILRMAVEAGFLVKEDTHFETVVQATERFYAAVRSQALEDAAKVCEAIRDEYQRRESLLFSENKTDAQEGADDCAAAIRGMK